MTTAEPTLAGDPIAPDLPEEWNAMTKEVIGCAMEVHTALGPGLLERLYEEALEYELRDHGFDVRRQMPLVIPYKTILLKGQVLDLLVNDLLVLELKATESVADLHLSTMMSYMKAAKAPLGLLINFNVVHLKHGIYRRLNTAAFPPGLPTFSRVRQPTASHRTLSPPNPTAPPVSSSLLSSSPSSPL